ncbi:MAG: hypothetical protein H7Y88_08715 [Phycisphaerales bacterium]|nr:hypothetical protein [Phycisphaerales bacterium]
MKADYLSFKRATNVALLGLILQLLTGFTLLTYSFLDRDHATQTASFMILIGSGVWLGLAIVFDQHRRERVEAMEAASLTAQQARASTVFEENADDLRLAAKRLAWMHRLLLPMVGLLLAGLLIGVGVFRFQQARELVDPDKFSAPDARGWAIALGLIFGVSNFLFARYVSGLGKVPMWVNLRAGAAQAVGSALVCAAIAIGQFVDYAGPDAVLRYLQVVFPAMMVMLGAEFVLSFLLNIYRPRKAGETPRPAFDSRVLGFVAAPDKIAESISEAINYQFGFDVTSSWFYRLLSRSMLVLTLVGVAVIWLMTAVAVVGPDERGIRIRNGARVSEVGPGAYVKWPWPVERVERFKATEARRLDLSSPPPAGDKAILWTNEHGVDEKDHYLLVRPSAEEADARSPGASATSDFVLVTAEVPMYYAVEDVTKYEEFAAPESRQELLKSIGMRALLEYMGTVRVDDLLGNARTDTAEGARQAVQQAYQAMNPSPGIRVLFVGIEGAHPPTETAASFEQVVTSEQTRESAIEQAQSERIAFLTAAAGSVEAAERVLVLLDELDVLKRTESAGPEAIKEKEQAITTLLGGDGGAASAIIRQAKAARWKSHMEERGLAERYQGELRAYAANPQLYAAERYFRTLRDVMAGSRVYIISDDVPVELRTNLEDVDTGGNALTTETADEEPG